MRRFQVIARIEGGLVGVHVLSDRGGHRQADVGVDIDLVYAVLDAFLNFLHRYAVVSFMSPPFLANDLQQVLRDGRRAMHHQMRVGNSRVDLFDAINRQNVAGGFARELVRAVRGANRNRQGIDAGLFTKIPPLDWGR